MQDADRVPTIAGKSKKDPPLLNRVSIGGDRLEHTNVRFAKYNFFVDDACPNVAEVLLHAWLMLQRLPRHVCYLAEALVMGGGIISERMRSEAIFAPPLDVLQVNPGIRAQLA